MEEQKYKELLYIIDDWFNKDPIIIQWSNGLKLNVDHLQGFVKRILSQLRRTISVNTPG